MENTENKGNQHKRKFKPLKIKKTDYSYLVTIFLSLLSAFFNFSEGYLILAMFIGSLAILILSADESGCLSCFIQFGIGAIIVLGLKHHVYLLVICLVIGILIHKMLDTRCSFKIDEEGFIEIGLDIIPLQDVQFIYTIKNKRTVFHTENEELTIDKLIFQHHNEQIEQYIKNFKNIYVFKSEEMYILTCAIAMIFSENSETKQSAIDYLKKELVKTDSEISELLYGFRNKRKEFEEKQKSFSIFHKNSIDEESLKNILGVLFQCATYKGKCSDQLREKIHSFSEMLRIPEETFLDVEYKYTYGNNNKDTTQDDITENDLVKKDFAKDRVNNSMSLFHKEKAEKEHTHNNECQVPYDEETKELINYYFRFWEDKNIVGPNGELYVGKVSISKMNNKFDKTKVLCFMSYILLFLFLILSIYFKNIYMYGGFIISLIILFISLYKQFIKKSYYLSVTPEYIILEKRNSSQKRRINISDISRISSIEYKQWTRQPYYYIIIGNEFITTPYKEDSTSDEYRCYEFFKEFANGNHSIIWANMYQEMVMSLFASIVNSTNDFYSKKYAINYLHQKYWSNDSIINVYKLFYSSLKNTQCINDNDYLKYRNITNYEERYILLDHLFECAYISDGVDEKEMEILQKAADSLHIKEWDIKSLKYKYDYRKAEQEKDEEKKKERKKNAETSFKNVITEAHRILGLKTDATIEEIKTVYHKLAMRVHPDKLPAGATPQQIEEANENFRVINEAYKFLLKKEEGKIYVNK